ADAFINMMALLGWNPGTEQEIFTQEQLSEAFDLEKVGKSGSKFDPEKTKWFNHQYLVQKSDEELANLYNIILKGKGLSVDIEKIVKVVALIKERATFVSDFWEHSSFFFEAPKEYDDKMVKKAWKEETAQHLTNFIAILQKIDDFNSANIEQITKNWLEEIELGIGKLMTPMRLALVGEGKGPHLFDIIEFIGKEETVKRINLAVGKLNNL
ncbi:MAG: glutamate--tRNA ligase, partial [Chloroflexia bacterium]|nr:glutamate--tRNA ligase [Chloroflexia bacterium]